MKHLLVAIGLVATLPARAQTPSASVPSYVTKQGNIYHVGDGLSLGKGSSTNGSFKYVYVPEQVWLGFPQQQLTAKWQEKRLLIKEVREQQTATDSARHAVAVVSKSGADAYVDLEAAEAAGEIQPPVVSMADELLKLKKLLDAKAITPSEFESQKAKLLSR